MSQQALISPEIRHWIVAEAQAGHTPQAMLASMLASGWQEEDALLVMESVLRDQLAQAKDDAAIGPRLKASTASRVWAHDRYVDVLAVWQMPQVVLLGNLMSDEECDALMALSRERLKRSETVVNTTGGTEVNGVRTSQGMFFERGEHPLCATVEARLADLFQWPVDHAEGLQVLRYLPGAEYRPHYDYFDPAQPGTARIVERGGQRVGTIVMYLNTPEEGGATTFPDAGLSVRAVKGTAVFFAYPLPTPASLTLHGGDAVIQGEKWVATKWLRAQRFS